MKKLIAIFALTATVAIIHADQVPLNFAAIGYTELLKPQSISYNAEVPAVEATEDNEAKDAIPASFTIVSLYRLGYKTAVVDTTINGVHAVIAPNSSPEFTVKATVPVSVFAQVYDGNIEELALILATVGTVKPDAAMCDVIRSFTFGMLQ